MEVVWWGFTECHKHGVYLALRFDLFEGIDEGLDKGLLEVLIVEVITIQVK